MAIEINIIILCLSGESFNIQINSDALVWELKQAITNSRKLFDYIICLFIENVETELSNKESLSSFNIVNQSKLFMLFNEYKLEWKTWGSYCYNNTLDKSIATAYKTTMDQLIKTSVELFYGLHYCEIILTNPGNMCDILFGAVNPKLSPNNNWNNIIQNGYFISMKTGGLISNTERHSCTYGKLCKGDKIGILLNYNTRTLTFYRNYAKIGQGFTDIQIKPLIFCVAMYHGVSQYWGCASISITDKPEIPYIESY